VTGLARPYLRRRSLIAAVIAAVTLTVVVADGGSAVASPFHHGPPPVVTDSNYLAIGDSVTFGYREATNPPTPDYTNATNFVGYPEIVSAALDVRVANAACPGETSTSLIEANAQSNGCENSPTSPVGYRTAFPLHFSYKGTQLAYAIRYLLAHPDTRLVSLMIGANDGFLCQETTTDGCASELPGVLKQVSANVTTILSALRTQGHYQGQLVIVNYYSLDYSSATANASSIGLNTAMDTAAKPFGARIADGYGLFQTAAAQAGGNSCTAGLLTTLSGGGCGVHPSVAGQALLAQAVEKAVLR
jgi:lysophospholipase L1-like esterase